MMKKSLTALAVGAALSAGTLTAQAEDADVTVYGLVHMSWGKVDQDTGSVTTTDNWQIRSHASRIGVKGSAKITEGLKGVYKLEYGADPFGGGSGLSRRNQYVGLAGNFGTVLLGRHDTPVKVVQGKFDEFNDTDGDMGSIVRGEQRVDNVLAYVSPTWGGFDFLAALIPGEGDGVAAGDGIADTISIGAKFKMKGFFVSLGHNAYDDTNVGTTVKDLTRVVFTYGMDMFQVGAMLESSSKGANAGNDKDVMGVSGHVKFAGKHKIKLQYVSGTTDVAGGDTDETQLSIGYDFKMSKMNTAYAMLTTYEEDAANNANDNEYQFFGVGLVQKF